MSSSSPVPAWRSGEGARWPEVILSDLGAFGALALISLLAGLGMNQARRQPLPLAYRSQVQRMQAAVDRLRADASPAASFPPIVPARDIGIEEFQAVVAAHRAPVVDARAEAFYREGHVPGAINLSREQFDADYLRSGRALSAHRGDAVIVYCSGADCHDADLVADALQALGFRRIMVYREGWEEWSQSGLPQEK